MNGHCNGTMWMKGRLNGLIWAFPVRLSMKNVICLGQLLLTESF
jgi:hypothetical protein